MTRRGWSLGVGALFMILAAWVFGIEEFYALAAAVIALLLAAWCWVHVRRFEVRTDRVVHPVRVAAGQTARVELIATNRHERRSPLLVAVDPSDRGRQVARFSMAPLDPGMSARASYPVTTHRRGVLTIGPLRLSVTDPFGVAHRSVTGAAASTVIVHPSVEPVMLPGSLVALDPLPATTLSTVIGGGEDFQGLREYAVGDDLRRVHWLSTARRDELMIRQQERPARGRLLIVVDLRAEVHSPSSLETLIAGAASLFDAGIRRQVEVRLVTTSGLDTGFGDGIEHRIATLDRLASVRPHGTRPLSSLPNALGPTPGGSAVVMSTDGASREDLVTLTCVPGARHLGLVLIERHGSAGHRRDLRQSSPAHNRAPQEKAGESPQAPEPAGAFDLASGTPAEWTVTVPPGCSFAEAWSRPTGRGGRDGRPSTIGWLPGGLHAGN